MRFPAVSLAFVAAILTVAPGASAREPVRDFSQLNTRLKPGDTVWVTDAQGREIKGKITDLRDASMTLDRDGTTMLQADNVRLVRQRKGSKLFGCLVGLGAGIAGGLAYSAAADSGEEAMGGFFIAGIGAGVGTLIGAFVPRSREVYRAPGAAGQAQARASVAPFVTRRAKGVAVSLAF